LRRDGRAAPGHFTYTFYLAPPHFYLLAPPALPLFGCYAVNTGVLRDRRWFGRYRAETYAASVLPLTYL